MKGKKILVVGNMDIGLYKFRKDLLSELINMGNEVHIALPNGDLVQPLVDMGCVFHDTPMERRGMNPIKDLSLYKLYKSIINSVKPDLVITYTVKPNVYAGYASKRTKTPYVVNITGLGSAFANGGMVKTLICIMYKAALKKCGLVIFENEGNRKVFLDEGLTSRDKTVKVNGAGVDTAEYEYTDYPENDDCLHFLFIGRVMKEKGMDELFAAMEAIKADGIGAVLDVVGLYEDDYEGRIKELEERGIVKFHGYQKDVKPFIKDCHAFVLPSYHEGMANTLLEAGSMGRPLITSNIHGCKEAVDEERNGLLVKVKDAKDLEARLREFINMPYDTKRSMGTYSAKYIREVFDKKKVVKATIKEIDKLFD